MSGLRCLTLLTIATLVWAGGVSQAAYLEGLLCEDPMPWPGTLARCAVGPATGGAWAAPTVGDLTGDGLDDLVVGSAYGDVLLYEGRADGVYGPPRLLLIGDLPEVIPTLQPAVPCVLRDSRDLLVLRAGRLLRYERTSAGLAAGREVTGREQASLAEELTRAGGTTPTSLAASVANVLFIADAAGRLWRATLGTSGRLADLGPLKDAGDRQLTFPPPVSLALADVNGDGQEELVVATGATLYSCVLSGASASEPEELAREIRTSEGLIAERLAPAVERPGVLILGTRWGTLLRCRVEKGRVASVEPVQAREVPLDCSLCAAPTALDWDRDGRMDLVAAGADGLVRLFLARPDGFFDTPASLSDSTGLIRLPTVEGYAVGFPAFADLDGDGRVDMLIGSADGRVLLFRNEGRFVATEPLRVGGQDFVCAGIPTPEPVDWDGDGDTDLIIGTQPRPASERADVSPNSLSPIQFLENQATRRAWCKYEKAVPIDMAARWEGVHGEGTYIGAWQLRLSRGTRRDNFVLVLGALGVYVFGVATVPPAYPRLLGEAEDGLLRPWRSRGPVWSICQFGDRLAVGLGPYGFITLSTMPDR